MVFLSVLFFGGFVIVLFFIIKRMISPKRISALKNYLKEENYKAAINLAKEIINKDRGNIEVHYYLAEAYYQQSRYDIALAEFKFAEKSGSYDKIDERKLRERLAELYNKTNEIDEALKEYILLTKKYSDDHEYFFQVGELFEQKNMTSHAVKYYTEAVNLNPNYIPALLNLGVLLFKLKNFMGAESYLQKAVYKEPENYKGFFYLGMIEKAEANYKNALKYFEKALKDKEYKIKSLMERGIIYIYQKKYDEAIIELDRALKNCEEENNIKMNIRYVLAGCYELNRNITDAIVLWEQIYAIDSKFRDVSTKLLNYQELRVDDRMKDFLTATDVDFIDMCKRIIHSMNLNVSEQEILSRDSIEFLCLETDTKWRNVKRRPKLIHISRASDPIDDSILKAIHDKMREKNIIRGVVITSSVYSKLAYAFVKERPIELIDKNGLQDILKEVSI
jgi:tetratricopeptide (TPR) repeat protein